MSKVLVINSSIRAKGSQSRNLVKLFIENRKKNHPKDTYTYREVGLQIIPPIDESWVASAFIEPTHRTPENQKGVALSNVLVEELKQHDVYVVASPMYNWSIPSGLKTYIDQVMRINDTWKFRSGQPDGDYVGLLEGKQLFILSARGDTGYGAGEKNEHMNFQTSYLKFVFGMMGVKNTRIISLDNEEFGGAVFAKSKKLIFQEINAIQ